METASSLTTLPSITLLKVPHFSRLYGEVGPAVANVWIFRTPTNPQRGQFASLNLTVTDQKVKAPRDRESRGTCGATN